MLPVFRPAGKNWQHKKVTNLAAAGYYPSNQ
jgi:hypothetical protein